jgi:hypothetical protein
MLIREVVYYAWPASFEKHKFLALFNLRVKTLSEVAWLSRYKINGKKLVSLKPVVRTRRSYKRVGLIKRQQSFEGRAMCGHEVLMSLLTRANFLATHLLRQ